MCVGFRTIFLLAVAFWMQSRYKPKVMPMNFSSFSFPPPLPLWHGCDAHLQCSFTASRPVKICCLCAKVARRPGRKFAEFQLPHVAPKKCLDVHTRFLHKRSWKRYFRFSPRSLLSQRFFIRRTHTHSRYDSHTSARRRHETPFWPGRFSNLPNFWAL